MYPFCLVQADGNHEVLPQFETVPKPEALIQHIKLNLYKVLCLYIMQHHLWHAGH